MSILVVCVCLSLCVSEHFVGIYNAEQRELEAALKLSLQLSSQRQRLQQLEEKLSKIPPEPSPTLSDTVQLVVRFLH
jgi:hypothetical protein